MNLSIQEQKKRDLLTLAIEQKRRVIKTPEIGLFVSKRDLLTLVIEQKSLGGCLTSQVYFWK
jgi:hypothetical protein